MKNVKITNELELLKLKELDQKGTIFFCFGNRVDLVKLLIESTTNAKIIGCTTSGAVYHNMLLNPEENLIVNVLELKKTEVEVFEEKFVDYEDSRNCGMRLGNKVTKRKDLAGVIILTEGLFQNSVAFSEGLNSTVSAPVMGGLASDNLKFEKTQVFNNHGIYDQSVVAIAFYGSNFHMKAFSAAGIKSFGIERKVTKSIKNVLYEIDNKPALDVYEKFLGKELSSYKPGTELNFPIEISENFNTKEGLIRTPLVIDREAKSITFTSEIPENSMIRLMMGMKNDLILAAETVDAQVSKYAKDNDIKEYNSFIVSCAARQIVMGEEVNMELPNQTNQFGFYAYGEFAPINTSCDLVNQTFTQGMIYER